MIDLPDAAAELIAQLLETRGRHILGITGAPGAGKSTASEAVLAAARTADISAVIVGMDGWHLAHSVLVGRRQEGIRGAPETFDAHGFVDAVHRVRAQEAGDPTIWLPEFRREIEDAVAGAIGVRPEHRLIVVEGNYLLLQEDPWDALINSFDTAWMLTPPDATRHERLVARHEHHGRDHADALERALGSDERNAQRVRHESRTTGVVEVNPG